jgi:hypothetical protein
MPSYIQTPNMTLRRFDPKANTVENVLAQIPIDQIREKYMADTIQHSPAITDAQRRAMVEAVLAQAQQAGPPQAPPMPQGPPPAMNMGGAPQPLPPGANTFGTPMGAPPVPSADQEAMRRAQIAQAIRQAAAGAH